MGNQHEAYAHWYSQAIDALMKARRLAKKLEDTAALDRIETNLARLRISQSMFQSPGPGNRG